MHVAFYAPLKPPDHPVPSGDRTMARLIMAAIAQAGHTVALTSTLRSHSAAPDADRLARFRSQAAAEAVGLVSRLGRHEHGPRPDAWLTYHPYYKAPDWIGPAVADALGIAYATVEASYAGKRNRDAWAPWQAGVRSALQRADVNFCMTARDREGVEAAGPLLGRIVDLPPFIDVERLPRGFAKPASGPCRLVAVAMMRGGDKLASYLMLAEALSRLPAPDWHFDVIGDGPAREQVAAAFSSLPAERIAWHGELAWEAAMRLAGGCDIYAWPGTGEAYGIAYLEAQALGLPVVAQDTAGVPAVVVSGGTGLLTPQGDIGAYADALAELIANAALRERLGAGARRLVYEERTLAHASRIICGALEAAIATRAVRS